MNLSTSAEQGKKWFESAIAAIILFLQLTTPLPLSGQDSSLISSAEAVLYSPETKIPRTGELALRRAIPANTNMKAIQVRWQTVQIYFPFFKYFQLFSLIGFSGGHIILAKDSTEKTIWNDGGQCQESSKGNS